MQTDKIVHGELGLNSCGIQNVPGSEEMTVRSRKDYTIMYLSAGRAQTVIDGKYCDVMPGEAMFFTPGEHMYRFCPGAGSINMWVHFSGTFCSVLDGAHTRIIKIPNRNEFESNIERLIKHSHPSDRDELLVDSYLRVIISQLRYSEQTGMKRNLPKNIFYLHDIISDIHMNPTEKSDWGACAAKCHISRDRFNHVFREHTGLSPESYRIKVIMERAKLLMGDFGMSVGECAETLCFYDVSYFCKRFRKEFGVSPGEFINNRGV